MKARITLLAVSLGMLLLALVAAEGSIWPDL